MTRTVLHTLRILPLTRTLEHFVTNLVLSCLDVSFRDVAPFEVASGRIGATSAVVAPAKAGPAAAGKVVGLLTATPRLLSA